MRLFSWLGNGKQADPAERRRPHRSARRRAIFRPRLELLEDRALPSSYTAATTSALIADINAANKAGGTNTITLTAPTTSPYVLTAVNNTSKGTNGVGANGLPVISSKKGDNLTIIGNGDTIERSTAAGTPAFRLFDVASGSSLTLENVTLQNGLAQGLGTLGQGGAIFNSGTLTVSGSTVSANTGSGAIANDGTLTVNDNSILSDNVGGGIFNAAMGMLTLSNSTLLDNPAGGGGGGIYNDGTAAVSASTLSGNSASEGGGIVNGGTLTLTGSTLSNNTASGQGGEGGGIWNGGTLTISASTLTDNTALQDGGGIYSGHGTLTITGSSLLGNSSFYGGGIYIGGGGTLTISGGSILSGNTAGYEGGGIYIYSGTVTISGSTVGGTLPGNSAAVAGGGIFVNMDGTLTVENSSSITGNIAPVGFGADVYNLGVLYLDSTSTIGVLDGNPAVAI
jgi:predicted outer membrane repeat protein